jgi:hypothetical protein
MRSYDDLSNQEKIQAILAEIDRPLSVKGLLTYAGVNRSDISDEEIEQVTSDPRLIKQIHPESGEIMYYPEDVRDSIFESLEIERGIVKEVIAIRMIDLLGLSRGGVK